MYIFDEMIDYGLPEGGKWTTKAHRKVAATVLLSNPRVSTRDNLMIYTKVINDIPSSKIKTVTLCDLLHLGIPLHLPRLSAKRKYEKSHK